MSPTLNPTYSPLLPSLLLLQPSLNVKSRNQKGKEVNTYDCARPAAMLALWVHERRGLSKRLRMRLQRERNKCSLFGSHECLSGDKAFVGAVDRKINCFLHILVLKDCF